MPPDAARKRPARLKPHPDPPADLNERRLPLFEGSGPWFRVYQLAHEPLFFGRTGRYRFDAPGGEYGVLYAAADAHGAFVETFGWRTGHAGDRVVGTEKLRVRGLARITATRPLRLVDLAGDGLARLGADARLGAGDSYALARRWALALWRHPSSPDGLSYRARHDPSRHAVALFDRTAAAVSATPLGSLADPVLALVLAEILATYEFGLVDELRSGRD